MQTTLETRAETRSSWLDRPLLSLITLNVETVLFATILVLAVLTRFYKLENRTMSHDETSHVYFSWLFFQGRGYAHDPVTHGPLQFHLVALTYFLFGDNDFTARIPAALFGIASVAFLWFYRRYLGRAGMLVAALLFVISPYMLYYARYVRNESFVALWGLLTLWSILRYFETGNHRFLYLLSAAIILHFDSKETAYIYTAQVLLFLVIYLIYRVTQQPWIRPQARKNFLLSMIAALILLAGAFAVRILSPKPVAGPQPEAPTIPGAETFLPSATGLNLVFLLLGLLSLSAFAIAAYYAIRGFSLPRIRAERSFDMLILVGALVLPLLSAFVINAIGWKVPTNVGEVNSMTAADILRMLAVVVLVFVISNLIGLWWNWRLWLGNFALFYAIFTVFYTSIFTNGAGLATGLVGSLGYWLAQQAVNRGSQPWYFYALVQVPVYEYLPALGSLLAIALVALRWRASRKPAVQVAGEPVDQPRGETIALHASEPASPSSEFEDQSNGSPEEMVSMDAGPRDAHLLSSFSSEPTLPPASLPEKAPFLALLIFWAITSLTAYSIAGEKMPWLTVHITLGMIVLAGWSIGQLIESTDWKSMLSTRGILVLALLPVFLTSFAAFLGSLLGANPPFQGKDLEQLQATSVFITAFLAASASGWGLFTLLKSWSAAQAARLFGLAFLALLALLTARTAFTASFINYNLARELLVYAHSGPGAKEAMAQIEEISRRITDGLDLEVAYDNETSYPFWWYLRDYKNQRYYAANPTRDLRQAPVILVGDANYEKIKNVVGQNYTPYEYIRMWWPDQGYFDLSWNRVIYAFTHPEWREALFQIWLNRDYTRYAQLINKDLSLPRWDPANKFRIYIRNDIISQIWDYGTTASVSQPVTDTYEKGRTTLNADPVLGGAGSQPGQFVDPRGVAVAPDGSLYILDTGNNRVQHLSPNGEVLNVWGSFADIAQGSAPNGAFNQPWGIAVAPDGSVYVADTWNHRIQKFTADGQFITKWGYGISQTDDPLGFYGPRGIAIDKNGYVYVTDTGNKRVVIFDADGKFIAKFGGAGMEPGQFNEPVGIAVDEQGNVYIADVWNQRMQVLAPTGDWNFTPLKTWDIEGWFGQSVNNYPFIALDGKGHLFATDPEGYRVLDFTTDGQFVHYWGDYGVSNDGFALPIGIASDPQGGLWVVDSGSARVMHFTVP